MARKEETPNMVERFAEFKELKNIDKTTMMTVLAESFRNVLRSQFGSDENFDVILNPDKGDVQIFQNLEIVPDGTIMTKENKNKQITLSDARIDNNPDAEVGEEHVREIFFEKFGYRAIQSLKQILQSKILDLQKNALYTKFKAMEGELVVGEVYQTWSRDTLLLDDEKNELMLPKSESIPGDYFRKGEMVRVVIKEVSNKNNNPKVTVSRLDERFLRRLFELEVPEIHDGLINIKAVARIPGERAKIAVESYDDRIDPVGACVGVKGSRIHGIVRELRNENIDVITYSKDPKLFIQRALAPAKINYIHLLEEEVPPTEKEIRAEAVRAAKEKREPEELKPTLVKKAEVYVYPEDVQYAIGKGGQNIKLACMLTGYQINVWREDRNPVKEEDIYLDEFRDEIDGWMIDELKNAGCITACGVLRKGREALIEESDLEEEQIDHIIEVLKAEFDDEDETSVDETPEEQSDTPEE